MAGTRINSYGASLAGLADRFRTTVSGAVYGNFFGEGAPVSRNLAAGGAPVRVLGEPAQGQFYNEFSSTEDYLDLAINAPDSYTHVFVALLLVDDTTFVVGNYVNDNVTGGGHWFYYAQEAPGDGIAAPTFANINDNAGTPELVTVRGSAVPLGKPHAFALRYDRAAKTKILNNLTTGERVAAVQSGGEVKRTDTRGLLLGSAYGSLGAGTKTQVFCEWLWPFAMSDDQLAAQSAQIKAYYARRGLEV